MVVNDDFSMEFNEDFQNFMRTAKSLYNGLLVVRKIWTW
jgi:hypothetical protein